MTSNSVVDLKNCKNLQDLESGENPAFVPTSKSENRTLAQKQLRQETEDLRCEIARFLAARKPGGLIETELTPFPTPLMARAMLESNCKTIGRVRIAPNGNAAKLHTVPLIVGPSELKQIHQTVLA